MHRLQRWDCNVFYPRHHCHWWFNGSLRGCVALKKHRTKPPESRGSLFPKGAHLHLIHLVVLSVFTAFQRLVFISGQFIYYLASTFKPNGSSSSTDYNQEKRNYKVLKSESDFVEAFISSPKRFIFPSTRPIWSLSLSLAISCQCLLHWTNHLAAKLNAVCKIESFQSLPATCF